MSLCFHIMTAGSSDLHVDTVNNIVYSIYYLAIRNINNLGSTNLYQQNIYFLQIRFYALTLPVNVKIFGKKFVILRKLAPSPNVSTNHSL